MNRPRRWDFLPPAYRWEEPEFGETPEGNYVLWEDYVELERRHQTIMEAIENMGSLENIRRVEVSQPIVIDMAHENACMKGTINRLIEAGDALVEAYFFDSGWNSSHRKEFNELSEVVAWNEAKRSNPNSSQPNA
jgi:hypothetical protein